MESEWQVYRTRFLVKARQLTRRMGFSDALGREHRGNKGDYLVESCDGSRRILPREFFEDVYVTMGTESSPPLPIPTSSQRIGTAILASSGKTFVEKRRPSQASRALIA